MYPSQALRTLSSRSFLSSSSAAFALLCCSAIHMAAGAEQPALVGTEPAQECARQAEVLRRALADEALWRDSESRTKEIRAYLSLAQALRAKSVAPILVPRIAYGKEPTFASPWPPLEKSFPVFGALKCIGIPAVPHLLSELKKGDPGDRTEEARVKRAFLVMCPRDIYDEGGHGRLMARSRLQLELEATKDPRERTNLEAALRLQLLREEPVAPERK